MTEQRHSSLALHELHLHENGHPQRTKTLRRAKWATIVVLILLALGAARTVVSRVLRDDRLAQSTSEQAKVYVTTVHATPNAGVAEISLPGTVQGARESPIYARSSGYLLHWYKDIGSHVAQGDLLALLDTPEVDQELSQARAAHAQTVASLALAKSSYERWLALRQKDAVSQQELDERKSAFDQASANVAAAQANVGRLEQLEGFKRIVAPFAGIVTRRNVDVGDLVDAGNGGNSRELFVVTQIDPLRLYVYVPQAYAQRVKIGQTVNVTQAELPGQVFQGTVTHTAGAIDSVTRTLQAEIRLSNRDAKLLPGSYVEVRIPTGGSPSLIVPSNTLLFRAEGPRIAVVDDSGHVRLHAVSIGREFGQTLEILSGLTSTDRIVLNPADSVSDGDPVEVVPQPAPSTPAAAIRPANAPSTPSRAPQPVLSSTDSSVTTAFSKARP